MTEGIRATVAFDSPSVCPMAEVSAETGECIRTVHRSTTPPGDAPSVTEFTLSGGHIPDIGTPVFDHGDFTRYRFTHDGPTRCPCECLGALGCPAARYKVANGHLTIVFYATDYDELQTAIAELRERFPSLDIIRLIQSPSSLYADDVVLVDRGHLTDRQLEVLEAAFAMGYFKRPRDANATEVANRLDIDVSTFSEHLATAQAKVLGDLLE